MIFLEKFYRKFLGRPPIALNWVQSPCEQRQSGPRRLWPGHPGGKGPRHVSCGPLGLQYLRHVAARCLWPGKATFTFRVPIILCSVKKDDLKLYLIYVYLFSLLPRWMLNPTTAVFAWDPFPVKIHDVYNCNMQRWVTASPSSIEKQVRVSQAGVSCDLVPSRVTSCS